MLYGGMRRKVSIARTFINDPDLILLDEPFTSIDLPVANALRRRLYFDEWYDWLMLKIFVPFAFFIAWFDKRGVDGVVKGIEKTSSTSSSWIRTLTTGSARDYIMMVALGTLVIFVLIGGAL